MIGRELRRGVGIGDRVRAGGVPQIVIGVSGTVVRLADEAGNVQDVPVTTLLADDRFELAGGPARVGAAAVQIGMDGLPAAAVAQARWWEGHIAEVVYGLLADAPAGTPPRPQYDPEVTSMTAREAAKAAELAAAGVPVTVAMVKRRRQRWEALGLPGLVDYRVARRAAPFGRVDPVVVAAMRQAIALAAEDSTRTAKFIIWRTGVLLAETGSTVPLPSRATLYRLFDTLSNGKHTTGSAVTRRGLAGRPQGMFGQWDPAAPGELMQIDSTPLDVLVLLEDGVTGRVELTGMIDVATRTVTAAVLRPTTRSVDACILLARTLTPEPMRPGWVQALSMARSVLPYDRLLSIDERLAAAAARPVIIPDTIVYDHGSVFVSGNFRSSCRYLGISLQPAHLASGSDKPHIERALGAVGTMFCEFVAGYLGRNAGRRGRHVHDQPLWSMLELQELLDEWLIAKWQNREHEELRDPVHPARAYTPNEKYAALVEAAGYVPVALPAGDYTELLPAEWRVINAYGIKINRRTYDSPDLNPFRQQPSGVVGKKNQWEIHYDPYDLSRIFVRGRDGWITCRWRYLDRAPMPFGELAWDHARRTLAARGQAVTEAQIADAVNTLMTRAFQGPGDGGAASRRDRRVAARTRAVIPPDEAPDTGAAQADAAAAEDSPDHTAAGMPDDQPLAKVIPLPVFDPFGDSDGRW